MLDTNKFIDKYNMLLCHSFIRPAGHALAVNVSTCVNAISDLYHITVIKSLSYK